MAEQRIDPSTGRAYNEIVELETYKGFSFTTRIKGDGIRVMMPNGSGIIDFADDIEGGKKVVDEYLRKVG